MLGIIRFVLAVLLLTPPFAAGGEGAGRVYRVGLLTSGAFGGGPWGVVGRLKGALQLHGYDPYGGNITVEHRVTVDETERPAKLANELVSWKPDVLVAVGMPAIQAASQATTIVPIVMLADEDPVRAGLVASLARPGRNLTGVTALVPQLAGLRLQFLRDTVPGLTRVGILWNPSPSRKAAEWTAIREAADTLGLRLEPLDVRRADDLGSTFAQAVAARCGALLVLGDQSMMGYAQRVTELAKAHGLPAIYPWRQFVEGRFQAADGLMSYGPDEIDLYRLMAERIDRVLKGGDPASLPIEQATRFELVINLRTAKALNLTIPPSVLVRADEVIE